jgi:hypothetical protein
LLGSGRVVKPHIRGGRQARMLFSTTWLEAHHMAAPLGRKNCFSHPRDPPRRNAGLFLLYAVLSLLNKMGLGDIPRASSFLEGWDLPLQLCAGSVTHVLFTCQMLQTFRSLGHFPSWSQDRHCIFQSGLSSRAKPQYLQFDAAADTITLGELFYNPSKLPPH